MPKDPSIASNIDTITYYAIKDQFLWKAHLVLPIIEHVEPAWGRLHLEISRNLSKILLEKKFLDAA